MGVIERSELGLSVFKSPPLMTKPPVSRMETTPPVLGEVSEPTVESTSLKDLSQKQSGHFMKLHIDLHGPLKPTQYVNTYSIYMASLGKTSLDPRPSIAPTGLPLPQ